MFKGFDRKAITQYVEDLITPDYIGDFDVEGIVDVLWGIDMDGEYIDMSNIEQIDIYEILERHDLGSTIAL